ncbi:hypothetical protein [Candidatus Nitrotoga sp. M5]|uniref:hypothetical protein n=1 Tax=Candidatus Nitrotoga sp. M5 TaxID=2890409 RepID=UPI001EF2EB01|nr:hypothetical protein [Candidatus Nitrotoga sp. M5]CAH1386154.1 hypothetical protein NTGM5_210004 [Candidatus Nitrotoga sp. M5]
MKARYLGLTKIVSGECCFNTSEQTYLLANYDNSVHKRFVQDCFRSNLILTNVKASLKLALTF